jgi:hypothetical protein
MAPAQEMDTSNAVIAARVDPKFASAAAYKSSNYLAQSGCRCLGLLVKLVTTYHCNSIAGAYLAPRKENVVRDVDGF